MNQKIVKNTLVLMVITLVSGLLLGFVYEITKDPIKKQEEEGKQEACEAVFPKASGFDTELMLDISDAPDILKENYGQCTIDEAVKALDSNGSCIGYVVTVTSSEGYGGDITLMMGIQLDGTLNGIDILAINETAGLGMNAKNDSFKHQFKNKKVEEFYVKKDTANADYEIEAISSATITSIAITKAVNAGLVYFNFMKTQGGTVNE